MAVLFVGNGINRKEGIGCSWDELLKEIFSEPTEEISETFGNTMRYEYIDSYTVESGYELKKKIADRLNEPAKKICEKTDPVHKSLMQLPFSCILTTNYDYSLEYSADPKFEVARTTSEREYSSRRYQEAGGKRVYHIHGECGYPSSVLLGFEHYAGTLEKMRGTIVKSTSRTLGGDHKFQLYDVLNSLSPMGEEWYYKLFTEDIYFLGFGFDASEEDIWWLLSYRKRLEKDYPHLLKNKLYYFDTSSDTKHSAVLRKMLKAFGVDIIVCPGSTYSARYNKAIEYLKNVL